MGTRDIRFVYKRLDVLGNYKRLRSSTSSLTTPGVQPQADVAIEVSQVGSSARWKAPLSRRAALQRRNDLGRLRHVSKDYSSD